MVSRNTNNHGRLHLRLLGHLCIYTRVSSSYVGPVRSSSANFGTGNTVVGDASHKRPQIQSRVGFAKIPTVVVSTHPHMELDSSRSSVHLTLKPNTRLIAASIIIYALHSRVLLSPEFRPPAYHPLQRMGESSPMMLQGPVGGPETVASGLLADLLRVCASLGARDRGHRHLMKSASSFTLSGASKSS